MVKKKPHWFEPYRKWAIGVGLSVVVVPAISMNWKHVQNLWASPEKVESLDKKVMTHEEIQDNLAKLVMEQQARQDKDDAVTKAQLDAVREQLSLIAELKKK